MFSFFSSIGGFITSIVNFIIKSIEVFYLLLKTIVNAFTFITSTLIYMPPFVLTFVVAIVSFCVFVQILNKGS